MILNYHVERMTFIYFFFDNFIHFSKLYIFKVDSFSRFYQYFFIIIIGIFSKIEKFIFPTFIFVRTSITDKRCFFSFVTFHIKAIKIITFLRNSSSLNFPRNSSMRFTDYISYLSETFTSI